MLMAMKKVVLCTAVITLVGLATAGGYWFARNDNMPQLPVPPAWQTQSAMMADRDVMQYPAQYATIDGHKTYYVTAGQGQPFVFLHGSPTQAYLWRNVLPYVAKVGKVFAFDWPGFGHSDKPYPPLGPENYDKILADFIDQVATKSADEKVILVIHDWSSMVAFHYAAQHPERIAGIVFMESLVPPIIPIQSFDQLGKPANFFKAARAEEYGYTSIVQNNAFVDLFLQTGTTKPVSKKAEEVYRAPFLEEKNREVLLVWPRALPIAGEPKFMDERVKAYGQWFLNSHDIPKLFLYADPGLFDKPAFAAYYKEHTPEVTSVGIGQGYHYIQEDNADRIGLAIAKWYGNTFKK